MENRINFTESVISAGLPFEQPVDLRQKPRRTENLIQAFLYLCGAISVLTTIGIVLVLGRESLAFFTSQLWEDTNKTLVMGITAGATELQVASGRLLEPGAVVRVDDEIMLVRVVRPDSITVERGHQDTIAWPHAAESTIYASQFVTLRQFFTTTSWNPQIGEFGIWALANATFMTTATAMLMAAPLGLGVAIYLSEYASAGARKILKPILEVLAGIPTVVYGYFALTFMTPLLRSFFGRDVVEIYNTFSAGLVMGILILPLVASMSEDALRSVPRSLREAAYALGATKLETAVKVVVPAALSGIGAAIIVALSRAIGETMIVAIAAGAGPAFTFNPFQAAETMTGHIVRISGGDLSYDSIDYNSIFAIGMMLFLMTLSLNIVSQVVIRRYREVYE